MTGPAVLLAWGAPEVIWTLPTTKTAAQAAAALLAAQHVCNSLSYSASVVLGLGLTV